MNNNTNNKGILLETGTNEFEIVEFSVGKVTYGMNVAKVREVINAVSITKMPNAHRYVDGVFTLRGKVIPLVNLATCLNVPDSNGKRIIVSELNNCLVGFLVDEVSRIQRISWTKMEPAPTIANSQMVVGIIKMEDRMIVLLDFEKIVSDINPEINKSFKEVTAPNSNELMLKRKSQKLLIAEDSPMLRELLLNTLHTAGYTSTISTENGKQAWDKLTQMAADNAAPLDSKINLVITDIEMPQMDGHHLIKRIRENEKLKALPVIIFSSLISEENRRKGEAIGATAQVAKPQITELISLIDKELL